MALPGMIGMNAMVGLAEEVTYGTSPGNSDHWLPIIGQSMAVALDIRDIPYLGVATAATQLWHGVRDNVTTALTAGGDLNGCAMYDDKAFLLVLKHAMGVVTTSGPATTQYTHTFKQLTDGVVGLSVQVVHGSNLATPSELYVGCRVASLELSISATEQMMFRAGLIAKSSGGMIAVAGTPAFAASEEVLSHQGATLGWNSHTWNLRSFRLSINNNLTRRMAIGSLTTLAPVPGGFGSVEVEFSYPWETHEAYIDFLAKVQADGTFNFTGSGDNAMQFTLHNMQLVDVSKPVATAGELVQTVRARCYAAPASSEQGVQIVVKNSNSAAV